MNKTYIVKYYNELKGFGDMDFDDLLKMWEFVIELKKNEFIKQIWITSTQEVYRKD